MPLTKARLKRLRQLTQRKHRDETGHFLIEGVRLVQEAVDSRFDVLEAYHTADLTDHPGGGDLLKRLLKRAGEVHVVSSHDMELISETVTFQGVLAVVRRKDHTAGAVLRSTGDPSVITAFDGVADPGNLGTMVRTCDWFGVNGVLVGRESVDLYNPKVVRSTMGSVFHLPIAVGVDLASVVPRARAAGYTVYVTDANGEAHPDRLVFAPRALLVFGNEAWGVSEEVGRLADVRVAIRRYGSAESLNVSVACGILLASLRRHADGH
jgi:TrmH family RNA methyltransferase